MRVLLVLLLRCCPPPDLLSPAGKSIRGTCPLKELRASSLHRCCCKCRAGPSWGRSGGGCGTRPCWRGHARASQESSGCSMGGWTGGRAVVQRERRRRCRCGEEGCWTERTERASEQRSGGACTRRSKGSAWARLSRPCTTASVDGEELRVHGQTRGALSVECSPRRVTISRRDTIDLRAACMHIDQSASHRSSSDHTLEMQCQQ
jgi:hypothetical protein